MNTQLEEERMNEARAQKKCRTCGKEIFELEFGGPWSHCEGLQDHPARPELEVQS